MAHRIWHKLLGVKQNRTVIHCSFAPAGAGSPTDLKGPAVIENAGLARVGVGEYFIAPGLPARGENPESVTATLQLAAAADRYVSVTAVNSANPSYNVRVFDSAGTAQDIAADANNRINVTAEYPSFRSRKIQDLEAIGHGSVIIQGSFAPNGTNPVNATSIRGDGVLSVLRFDVGSFSINCPPLLELESGVATYEHSSGADYMQLGGFAVQDIAIHGRVFTQNVRLLDGTGAAVDRAVGRINFRFVFKNSKRV